MAQMNLSTKQNYTHRHRAQTYAFQGLERERDRLRVCGMQMQTIIFRMDKQQGPTVQHR